MMDLCVFEMPDATMHQVDLAACEDVECLAEGVIPAVAGSQESPANPSAAEDPAFQSEESAKVHQALKKLHANLGHPSNRDLVRILQHSKASEQAINLARKFECTVCASHQKPSCSLPAKMSRTREFNERVGLDVKYLPAHQHSRLLCLVVTRHGPNLSKRDSRTGQIRVEKRVERCLDKSGRTPKSAGSGSRLNKSERHIWPILPDSGD